MHEWIFVTILILSYLNIHFGPDFMNNWLIELEALINVFIVNIPYIITFFFRVIQLFSKEKKRQWNLIHLILQLFLNFFSSRNLFLGISCISKTSTYFFLLLIDNDFNNQMTQINDICMILFILFYSLL